MKQATLVLCFTLAAQVSAEAMFFASSLISRSRLTNSLTTSSISNLPNAPFSVRQECAKIDWCRLYCDEGDGVYSLWNLLVDPPGDDASAGPKVSCWSNRRRGNLLTQAGTKISGVLPNDPAKPVDGLKDGIHGKTLEECYITKNLPNPYFVVELPIEKIIFDVRLNHRLQSYIVGQLQRYATSR